jgi:MFS family permease
LIQVFKNKQNWLLLCYGGLAFASIAVFGGLWGYPFLQQAYQLNKMLAGSMISLIVLGLGIGSPLIGIISGYLGDRRNIMFYSTLISCVSISLVLYCPWLPLWAVGTLLFVFGFALGAYMLTFVLGKELNSLSVTATVVGMINIGDALLTGITEPVIGKLLDMGWDGKIINGVHYFSLHSYQVALSVLPLYMIVAALLLLRVKISRKEVTECLPAIS